ncbi:DNA-binding transcriptional regulator, LysR family [Aliiroseovarius halocynthiae]|uniref:LysR family transcriptional regulator n=1 Tax=Aliiroseovarius halocynthiae TaxID=985055 RepID=A0A545SQ16_9RHOB|nr:LysR family transcriptional regulator [Aliiroseovarius halocynthiae]TQV67075.1 LysR family transcriptional regulator [Aliiroseovarius halocynthiae]SMR82202.1 DNA-binding transcriptional regulator, LysR family [Aliiroseovarius halocynthiae]
MDIVWLKDFEALVACRNFSRAAEDRNVSQPAFSRRIRALENDIGVRLINRETLPLTLTPAGDVFLSQARLMLRTYEETIERCQTIDAAKENVIRIAASQSLYMTHYKQLIAPLATEGGVETDLNSTSWAADQFVSALQQHYCDAFLTYWHPSMDYLGPLEVANFEHMTLARDRFVPVSRCKPGGSAEFTFSNTAKEAMPLLSYGAVSALRSVQDFVVEQIVSPRKVFVVNQNALANSVKAMILEGFGMGWLPLSLCRSEIDAGMLTIVDSRLTTDLEIRIYRDPKNSKGTLNGLWDRLSDLNTNAVPFSSVAAQQSVRTG